MRLASRICNNLLQECKITTWLPFEPLHQARCLPTMDMRTAWYQRTTYSGTIRAEIARNASAWSRIQPETYSRRLQTCWQRDMQGPFHHGSSGAVSTKKHCHNHQAAEASAHDAASSASNRQQTDEKPAQRHSHISIPSSQSVFLASSVATMGGMMAHAGLVSPFWWATEMLTNVPSSVVCFGAADLLAQRIEKRYGNRNSKGVLNLCTRC